MVVELTSLIEDLTTRLDQAQISYFFTGGVASIYYGEPRTTQDIDIVLQIPDETSATKLLQALDDNYFIDPDSIREAIRTQSLGQALHKTQFAKIDLHFGALVPGEFSRIQTIELYPGVKAPLLSREDALLSKLMWIKLGSHRSRRDVVGMLRNPAQRDDAFIQQQAEALGVADLLHELRSLALGEETEQK